MAEPIPKGLPSTLTRRRIAMVKCMTCGQEKKVDAGASLQRGWPICCSYTMRLIGNPWSDLNG